VLVNSRNACWICGKFVSIEDSKPDAFGFAVHKECNKRSPLKEAQLPGIIKIKPY
jgi:hypothetical protein